jgi:hypothetical protein
MERSAMTRRTWLHIVFIIVGLPLATGVGSISIRVFHFQFLGPILFTLWFVYGAWFLFARGVYRP